ncbi:MAG: ATP-binding cassette domain-containing protein [Bacilli bacterium]
MGINLSEVKFAYYIPKGKNRVINYTLDDINLSINSKNEFIAIVGHTGSGKSTLVQLMNALLIPTSGTVQVYDTVVTNKGNAKLKKIRKKVGLVFQFPEYQIFEDTVLKDIMFGPKNFKMENPEVVSREVAKIMGIEDLLEKSPFTLSGGQMRKVAIAGILASNPEILILDEPTAGLDPNAKEELLQFLKELNTKFNKSIIVITHDMNVVSKFIDRVIVLKSGEVMYDGKKEELFKNKTIIDECNLDYPETVKLMMDIKERTKVDLDVFQYNIEDAYHEIVKKIGVSDE